MYKIESQQHDVTVIICDRCSRRMTEEAPDNDYNNRTQIRFRAGYASLFGDCNKVEGDLCDRCLYELLGPYLRIVEPSPEEAKAYNNDPHTPLDAFFDLQAKRVYSPYQTQFQTAEEVACAMRDWIDQHFDPKLKRTPVIAKAQKNE